jgi:hypothetical protein
VAVEGLCAIADRCDLMPNARFKRRSPTQAHRVVVSSPWSFTNATAVAIAATDNTASAMVLS